MGTPGKLIPLITALSLLAGPAALAADDPPAAVASIKPIHSLLSGVMKGIGTPKLIVRGGGSPHTFALRPSDAEALQKADIVVWVGEGMETFLTQPLKSLAGGAHKVELSRADGIVLERTRTGALWEVEDEDSHGEGSGHREGDTRERHEDAHKRHEDAHGHREEAHEHREDGHERGEEAHEHREDGHKRGEEAHEHREDGHKRGEEAHEHREDGHKRGEEAHEHREDGHDHAHGEFNLHLWLHPANAAVIVKAMVAGLAEVDPPRAAAYRANGDRVIARLRNLDAEIREILAPVARAGFIVFHDAWQYFDTHYGLRALGSITASPEHAPGAARLVKIRERLSKAGVACIFAEPQFEPRVVTALVADTGVRTGEVDPLGSALEDGEDLYFELMRGNARAFRKCLES